MTLLVRKWPASTQSVTISGYPGLYDTIWDEDVGALKTRGDVDRRDPRPLGRISELVLLPPEDYDEVRTSRAYPAVLRGSRLRLRGVTVSRSRWDDMRFELTRPLRITA